MNDTGLVSPHHAALLRHILTEKVEWVPICLGLTNAGTAEWQAHKSFISSLIQENISVENFQCIYGLSNMINRNIFSDGTVKMAIQNLRRIRIDSECEDRILKSDASPSAMVTARQHLIGATLCVLGQPLGVGQGNNPTCQSARGISIWSQYAPARLVNLIITAATQNNLSFRFEEHELQSRDLPQGLLRELDYNLDAVSVVLIPHLDKIYSEMVRQSSGRGEDPHKWVNPAMYGNWVPIGFASAYDYKSHAILDYRGFLRIFFRHFHLSYNGGRRMVYPNPVGIFLTNAHGKKVGFHAVSFLRVALDNDGELRAFFHNPNNEGRQNWGQGIGPSVAGHGEIPGESSLPFYQFAARVYAFHFSKLNRHSEKNELPDDEILRVDDLARQSWGKDYTWIDQPKNWYGNSTENPPLVMPPAEPCVGY